MTNPAVSQEVREIVQRIDSVGDDNAAILQEVSTNIAAQKDLVVASIDAPTASAIQAAIQAELDKIDAMILTLPATGRNLWNPALVL